MSERPQALPAAVREHAEAVGREIARRVRASLEANDELPGGDSFSHGRLGMAMLVHAADSGSDESAAVVHDVVGRAARSIQPVVGLYSGMSGYLAALAYVRRDPSDYADARAKVAASLRSAVLSALAASRIALRVDKATDVIAGLAGVQLAIAGEPQTRELRSAIGAFFVELVRALAANPGDPVLAAEGKDLNLGLAHGIPGILAAQCLVRSDAAVDESIAAYARLMLEAAHATPDGPAWTSERSSNGAGPLARAAWCYGAPGISVALALAADRLHDEHLASVAAASVMRLRRIERRRWSLEDFGLCHGLAGIALTAAACARMLGDPFIADFAATLTDELAGAFDVRLRFGYRAMERPAGVLTDDAGLLMGASGIGLALLTLSGSADPSWTRVLGFAYPR